jgi:hypothetical protein
MAQIKIYGIKDHLNPIKQQLSDVIHECVVEALQFPPDKRAHRFFPMEKEDLFAPSGRGDAYTIIEISMITGRRGRHQAEGGQRCSIKQTSYYCKSY